MKFKKKTNLNFIIIILSIQITITYISILIIHKNASLKYTYLNTIVLLKLSVSVKFASLVETFIVSVFEDTPSISLFVSLQKLAFIQGVGFIPVSTHSTWDIVLINLSRILADNVQIIIIFELILINFNIIKHFFVLNLIIIEFLNIF